MSRDRSQVQCAAAYRHTCLGLVACAEFIISKWATLRLPWINAHSTPETIEQITNVLHKLTCRQVFSAAPSCNNNIKEVRGHALSRVFYFENKYDFYYSILY
jgi:hypothetical protein